MANLKKGMSKYEAAAETFTIGFLLLAAGWILGRICEAVALGNLKL